MFRNTVSPSDRRIIEHFLRDSDKELNEIKTTIMALESKQNGLKKKMDRYRTLLSPIHRLPPEVIVQVFTEVCDKNELYKKKLPSALALSRVCGRWRDIALATPRLWSSLRIPVVSWDSDEGDRVASLTRLFIERSRTAPLTLELWADIPDVDLITFIGHESWGILRGRTGQRRTLKWNPPRYGGLRDKEPPAPFFPPM
ncbi:hypothetical protein MPER_04790 [Moniliophthora perniciosa FA553]|nr:hypothetical protein MPER_04790 [Moniliophthora perniciosa FA553]